MMKMRECEELVMEADKIIGKYIDKYMSKWNEHNSRVEMLYARGDLSRKDANKILWDFKDVVKHCNGVKERTALVVGIFISQMNNGGIMLWINNGYARDCKDYFYNCMTCLGDIGRKVYDRVYDLLNDYLDDEWYNVYYYVDATFEFENFDREFDELVDEFVDAFVKYLEE